MEPPERMLVRMAQGYQLSQALYVVAKLGVADAVGADGRDIESLAAAVGARPRELRRVLRALVAVGVFTETDDGRIVLNDTAAALRSDAPGRTRDVVVSFGEEMYRAFGELLHSVQTGGTGFEAVYGQPLFEYYGSHPDTEATAAARMVARSLAVARDLATSGLCDGITSVVDVAGGSGAVLGALLEAHPHLRGALFERPTMLPLARQHLDACGVGDRCELVDGDFFVALPEGGDLYVLKSVLHDWDDERSAAILRTCRAALGPSARVAVVELVLPERLGAEPAALHGALLDLIMMTYAGGRERTQAEFEALFAASGLRLDTVIPLAAGPAALVAAPA